MPTRLCEQSHPALRTRYTRTVGCDSGVSIHLAIDFGDQYECQASPHRFYETRAGPNRLETIERVPYGLRLAADFLGGHGGMRPVKLGPQILGNQPPPGDGYAGDLDRFGFHFFFPAHEIHGAGVRGKSHELSKGNLSFLRGARCRIESFGAITW